jgi:tRNA A37 threonylcarbamoyladenosine dehydratase
MVNPLFQRLALLTGEAGLDKLKNTRVLVFGLGGVGGWTAEALVRSGVGTIGIVDSDTVCVTNINRQNEAFISTIGQFKAEALEKRLHDINPACKIEVYDDVYTNETAEKFRLDEADYIIDAIDSLQYKIDLIIRAAEIAKAKPGKALLYSSMGMALKLDPTRIRVADIWETEVCPLARYVRAGLRKRGFDGHFPCVYSTEMLTQDKDIPITCGTEHCLCCKNAPANGNRVEWCSKKAVINGSAVTVTATAGMFLASLVINDVLK